MRHTRKFILVTMAVAGAAAILSGVFPASAATRLAGPGPSAVTAVRAASTRPALPPRPGTAPAGRLRTAAASDTVGCYDQESIESAQNLNWVSAELGYTGARQGMLRARAASIGPWEKFALCYDYTGGFWYMVSDASGLVVSAEFGYSGPDYAMLRARAGVVGPWEKFTLSCHVFPIGPQTSFLVIQSQVNGNYVSAELGYTGDDYAMLRARATAISNTEYYVTQSRRIGC